MNKPNTIPAVALLAALCLLTACSPGPFNDEHYMEMDPPTQRTRTIDTLDLPRFEKPADEPLEPAAQPPEKIELTLEQCRAMALSNNLDIQVELLNPTISAQSIGEEEARFEWLLFGDVTHSRTDTPTASSLSGSKTTSTSSQGGLTIPLRTGGSITASVPIAEFETNNSFSTLNPSYTAGVDFSISQPLLRDAGPRTATHAIRLARYESWASEARTKLQVMRILADIDRVYWRHYAAWRELEVRKQQYDLAQAQLDRAKRLVEQGQTAEIEVIRAESGLASRLEGIILAQGKLQDRERELKQFLNNSQFPIGSWTILQPTTKPNPRQYNLDDNKLAEEALAHRMELLESEIQLVSDASTIDYLRNQALPVLNLDYTYGINGLGAGYGQAFDQVGDKDYEDHSIGARAEIPLGNQAAKSRLRRAAFSRIQHTHSREARKLLIHREVLDAVGAINTNWQRIVAAQRSTLLATRTYEAEQRQFEQGLRTSTDVLVAQAALADAQLSELSAIADYEIAQVDLAVATGTLMGADKVLWEPSEPNIP